MPFLLPNQQCQSTEGIGNTINYTTEPQIPSRIYEKGNFIIVMGNSAETTTI